jgi:hypothetical protein
MRKYTEAPHPFVFEPHASEDGSVRPDDRVSHGLVIIGEAIRYLPHFFLALEELGRGGLGRDQVPYRVERVWVPGGAAVFDRQEGHKFRNASLVELDVQPGGSRTDRFAILLQTPARIVVERQLARRPSLVDVVRALCRRAFLLRYFHCGGSEEPVSSDFVEAARAAHCRCADFRWIDAKRYSTRQDRDVPIGGAIGRLECKGDLGLLRPLLLLGQYVHVGKNATFGLGKFILQEGPRP